MHDKISIIPDGGKTERSLWKRLGGPLSILAGILSFLLDVGDAASGVTDMIPQALAFLEALLPIFMVMGTVAAICWGMGTAMEARSKWKINRWRNARAVVEPGFLKLRAACEPETVDQDDLNIARLKADARDYVNEVIPMITGPHPGMCTTDEESLQKWYEIFAQLRMTRGTARLAVLDRAGTL